SVNNSGTINVGDGNPNSGTLTVLGDVTNNSTGTINVKAGGKVTDTLINSGAVNNAGTYIANVKNSTATGIITNQNGGVWTGNLLSNTIGAKVDNQVGANWNGDANNTAIVINSGTWTTAAGGFVNNLGGTLTTTGTLDASASATGLSNSG